MEHDPNVVKRVLELLRTWGWEASLDRLEEKIGQADSECEHQAREHFLGWMAAERGDFDEANRRFHELAETDALAGWAKLGLAFVAMRSRDMPAAWQWLEQADAKAGDDVALAGALQLMRGTTFFHQGNSDAALDPLENAAKLLGPNSFLQGRALDALGMWYANHDDFQAAMEFFRQAIEHKKKFADDAGLAVTHGQLGRLYLNWGRLKLAEQHFREDLDIARRIGDLRGESQMYNFLGIVALRSEDLESAAAYLDHCMAMAQRGKWTVAEGFARKDRGLCCLAEGQKQPAEVQFQLAEQLFSEVGFAEGIAHVNRGLGVLLRMNAKWLESEQRLRRSLQHFEQAGELTEIVLTRLEMARTLRESSAPLPLVRDSFLDALRYAERSRRPHLVQEVERELEVIAPEAARRHIYRRVRGRWIDEDSTSLVSAEQDILTVFFFDLQGFTAWSRKTDPSVVMLCLNQMMAAFLDSTTRQEIQVIEYMGDGFLALARGPHHAHRAVQAALDLHVALAQFNRPRKLLGLAEFACRLGVSTGEVVLGNVGTYEKIDFRAVGTTVNMAARLQNEAIPGRPCIARSTWDVVQSDFDYEDNCPRSLFLKGIGDVDAWDVIGPTEH